MKLNHKSKIFENSCSNWQIVITVKSDMEQRCYAIFMKSGWLSIEKGFIKYLRS